MYLKLWNRGQKRKVNFLMWFEYFGACYHGVGIVKAGKGSKPVSETNTDTHEILLCVKLFLFLFPHQKTNGQPIQLNQVMGNIDK